MNSESSSSQGQSFNWKQFHSCRFFDESLERFVIGKRSYVTAHAQQLNVLQSFDEIRDRIVIFPDGSGVSFEEKDQVPHGHALSGCVA